jgi:hypothetical protein
MEREWGGGGVGDWGDGNAQHAKRPAAQVTGVSNTYRPRVARIRPLVPADVHEPVKRMGTDTAVFCVRHVRAHPQQMPGEHCLGLSHGRGEENIQVQASEQVRRFRVVAVPAPGSGREPCFCPAQHPFHHTDWPRTVLDGSQS